MAKPAMAPTVKGMATTTAEELFPDNVILLGYRGSIAHGMYRNPAHHAEAVDDKDLLGVAVGPIETYLGLDRFEQKEAFRGEWDVVTYEVRKMIRLLAQANPNVLSLLWLEPHSYISIHPLGQRLIDARDLFVTKQAYHAFTGYAYAQLKRMTHFGDAAFKTGYLGAKRKTLVEKYGYDTKNAAHLVRLLRMGIEFMNEGRLYVQRPDAPQLMEIKMGEWTLDQVKAEADHLFRRAEDAYDRCRWPREPDRISLNNLSVGIVHDFFASQYWFKESPLAIRTRGGETSEVARMRPSVQATLPPALPQYWACFQSRHVVQKTKTEGQVHFKCETCGLEETIPNHAKFPKEAIRE